MRSSRRGLREHQLDRAQRAGGALAGAVYFADAADADAGEELEAAIDQGSRDKARGGHRGRREYIGGSVENSPPPPPPPPSPPWRRCVDGLVSKCSRDGTPAAMDGSVSDMATRVPRGVDVVFEAPRWSERWVLQDGVTMPVTAEPAQVTS